MIFFFLSIVGLIIRLKQQEGCWRNCIHFSLNRWEKAWNFSCFFGETTTLFINNLWWEIELKRLALISVSLMPSEQLQPGWQSVSNQGNQAGKQPKQTAGGWVMVGRCSRRSDLTPRRGGLMTNWCSSSIIVSTLPTPLGLLNGSILSVTPLFLPLALSLCLLTSHSSLSLSTGSLTTPTHPPSLTILSVSAEGGTVGV